VGKARVDCVRAPAEQQGIDRENWQGLLLPGSATAALGHKEENPARPLTPCQGWLVRGSSHSTPAGWGPVYLSEGTGIGIPKSHGP
jgi:hypothetical protein